MKLFNLFMLSSVVSAARTSNLRSMLDLTSDNMLQMNLLLNQLQAANQQPFSLDFDNVFAENRSVEERRQFIKRIKPTNRRRGHPRRQTFYKMRF